MRLWRLVWQIIGFHGQSNRDRGKPIQDKAVLEECEEALERTTCSIDNLKQLQCLNGRVAAHNRFISRSTDKCLPLFKILITKDKFKWIEECNEALSQLKQYMSTWQF